MNITINYQIQSIKFNPRYNYQHNNVKKNNINFHSNSNIKILEEKVFKNPKAIKIIDEAMMDLKFNEATIDNTKNKLEELLNTKIERVEMSELFLERFKR